MARAATRKRPKTPGSLHLADIAEPMTLVPCRAPGVEQAEAKGLISLRLALPSRNAVERFTERHLGFSRAARLNLDAMGTACWRLMDGKRNVGKIAAGLATQFAFKPADSRLATLKYIRELLLRGFLVIQVPGAPEAKP
jgi:hypothetical protein